MMAGQHASRAHAEAGLRTEKLREQDLRRRAAALGPVPIHVYFQNRLVLQVTIMSHCWITLSGLVVIQRPHPASMAATRVLSARSNLSIMPRREKCHMTLHCIAGKISGA